MTTEEIKFCENISDISLGEMTAKFNTIELCKDVFTNNIPGDLAEAGVFAGCHPIIMSFLCKQYEQKRAVHMIDSFMGIPKVLESEHEHDQQVYGIRKEGEPITSSGISNVDLPGVKGYVNQFGGWPDVIKYHAGWFQDTLPTIEINELALLRIDVDLVESVNLCLKYLYPKINNGGWFICDDYYSPTCKVIIDNFIKENNIEDATVIGSEASIIYWKIKK